MTANMDERKEYNIDDLINRSHEMKNFSHSPYSNFRVGAALVTEDGSIFSGMDSCQYYLTLGLLVKDVTLRTLCWGCRSVLKRLPSVKLYLKDIRSSRSWSSQVICKTSSLRLVVRVDSSWRSLGWRQKCT
ncbi:uncharacterized protein LOC135496769 isoform X3 [Lineus longissimus]|uniref:uncharacterized protein LOC135496769 isoform X3 n=1 Tax=Lineus longissimus TaxID=88925 RepID=UPI002B4E9C7E